MKVLSFVKFIALSVAAFHAHLLADTYKLEVKKDKQAIRFCVHNFTRKCTYWFSVKKVGGSYESGDSSICGCIHGITIGTGVEFNFGGFQAKFDDKNNQLNLYDGDFRSTLLLENGDCPTVVPSATVLRLSTLIVKKAIFKNEGTLEAFITILQECSMIKNKGKFHADNLFLFKTDVRNYGMILWNDIGRIVDGNIIPKAANSDFPEKKGFTQMGPAMYNTRVLPLESTYHKKAVVREGRLQVKELTDGSLNVCNIWRQLLNYTAVLVGHLDACDGIGSGSGITLNFYPGSCFVVKAPVVIGSNVTLNLGCSDDPSWGNCSLDDTINVKSGSGSPLNNPKGGSKNGIWISQSNGWAPLFPHFDTVKTYRARETEELMLYIIYGT